MLVLLPISRWQATWLKNVIHTRNMYAASGYLWSRAKYTMDEIHFGLTVTLTKFIKFKFICTHYVAKTITQQIRKKQFAFVVVTSTLTEKREWRYCLVTTCVWHGVFVVVFLHKSDVCDQSQWIRQMKTVQFMM